MKKFTEIVSKDKVSGFEKAARHAIANRAWLEKSFEIALLVLTRLRELKWTQVQLAEAMNVSPQYINKIVKGKENLSLETITKLESILNISILNIRERIKKDKVVENVNVFIVNKIVHYKDYNMATPLMYAEKRKPRTLTAQFKGNFSELSYNSKTELEYA